MASRGLVVVRRSRVASCGLLAWLLFLESFGVAALAQRKYSGGVFLTVMWWPWLIATVLGFRDEVRIEGDWLVARGWFRERRWDRSELREIVDASPPLSPNIAYLRVETGAGARSGMRASVNHP